MWVDPRGDDHLGRNYSGTPNALHTGKRNTYTKSPSEICRPDFFPSFVRQGKWWGGAWKKRKGENREYFHLSCDRASDEVVHG